MATSWGADNLNISVVSAFRFIDLTGVFLNGIIGGRLARSKRFDAVGFMVLAIMSAMGGGIIRDVMLAAGAPFAITDPYYLYTALAGALVALLFRLDSKWSNRFVIMADGVVLGVWSATGVIKTLNLGFGPMPALLMGMLTAIGGGMIRDIAAGNVPMVFGGNYLYATPAAVASLTTMGFWYAGEQRLGMICASGIGFIITMMAHWRKWTLPAADDWTITMTATQLRRMMRKQREATIEKAVAQAVSAATETATEVATEAAVEVVREASEHPEIISAEIPDSRDSSVSGEPGA
ncbi:TRIC cation channel family protein [Actinomycetaceae bacterium TAE3-ERU4]|nr:TRIC cation channel family protein [Actinomycetaceae bacterium TAE3-ERU4]